MKLIYAKYGMELILEETRISTLVIENPVVLCDMLQDLANQINGNEGEWILSEADKVFSLAKSSMFVSNPLGVDCNEKRIITKIYKELDENVKSIMHEQYCELNSNIVRFMEQLLNTVPYHLDMELIMDAVAVLKAYDVRIMTDSREPLERLVDYLRAISSICGIRVVFVLNLKQFFSREQVSQLYEFCFYEKIYLINIEGVKNYILKEEKYVIIDKDLCLIEAP